MMPSCSAFCPEYTEVSMLKACMKLSSAKILSAFLLVLCFGLAKPAHAEGPVTARLQESRPRNQKLLKPFIHPRGPNSLARLKREAKIHGPVSVPGLLSSPSLADSSTLA